MTAYMKPDESQLRENRWNPGAGWRLARETVWYEIPSRAETLMAGFFWGIDGSQRRAKYALRGKKAKQPANK